ncbi:hypothetical protein DRO64_05875 [Candidatus Bathyarchaeota archaeon]|nr:MAG: hypothetical protein DRO64_05875 [Candidatus Bathyarchaeota archaeon]
MEGGNGQRSPVSVGIGVTGYEPLLDYLLRKLHKESVVDEIILVANAASLPTLKICKKWQRLDQRVKLIEYENRIGINRVINEILRIARGKIIVIIDADAIPVGDSIKRLIERFKDGKIGAVSARQVPIKKPGIAAAVDRFTWQVLENYKLFMNERNEAVHLGAVMYAFRKSAVEDIPDSVAEEEYLGAVILSRGFKVVYEDKSFAYFNNIDNVVDLLLQRARIWSRHFKLNNYVKSRKLYLRNPKKFAELAPWNQFKIIIRCLRAKPRTFGLFIIALVIEIFSLIYASIFLRHKDWVVILSSKKIRRKDLNMITNPNNNAYRGV